MENEERRPWWVEDVRSAWRWLGVQLSALVTVAPELYNNSELIKRYLSPNDAFHVMSLLGVLALLNNVRNKKKKSQCSTE